VTRVDPNDPRSPYRQIADDLRRAIEAGEFAPGERLPSTRDLAAKYGVAAMTVHQAMRLLREQGFVDSFQGRGVFIRSDHEAQEQPNRTEERPDLSAQIEDLRRRVGELIVQVPADTQDQISDIRRQLGLLQAQLMDLYARTGHSYPHEQSSEQRGSEEDGKQRRASNA